MNSQFAGAFAALMVIFSDDAKGAPEQRDAMPSLVLQPYAARTAGELAKACIGEQAGCADIVGKSLMDKVGFGAPSDLCLPGPNYAHGVAAWLNAHPDAAGMEKEDGIFVALKALYSCEGPADH